ncbi:hypothetical protein EYF80_023081 [Liparis tanakae]|uniref:Uncharacterized protein n=1 Tax=Liparis tanakae TaxID=230148 RepID=A0A4Z2HPI7_9TELE|nr:hypothetical protein EYF80_023081 [Liparis tanakae]
MWGVAGGVERSPAACGPHQIQTVRVITAEGLLTSCGGGGLGPGGGAQEALSWTGPGCTPKREDKKGIEVLICQAQSGKEAPGSPSTLAKGNSRLGTDPKRYRAKDRDANGSRLQCKQTTCGVRKVTMWWPAEHLETQRGMELPVSSCIPAAIGKVVISGTVLELVSLDK